MNNDPEVVRKISELLGTEEPLSDAVLTAISEDALYEHHLLVSRGFPEFQAHLLRNPPRLKPRQGPAAKDGLSFLELATNLSKAMLRWAKAGFSLVSEDAYQRRLAACYCCPHLRCPQEELVSTALQ